MDFITNILSSIGKKTPTITIGPTAPKPASIIPGVSNTLLLVGGGIALYLIVKK